MTSNRKDIQTILENNPQGYEVLYSKRPKGSEKNIIVYTRIPLPGFNADDSVYKQRTIVQVSHFHKRELDSIEQFLLEKLNAELVDVQKEDDTDYYHSVYHFSCLIKSGGWYG